LLVSPELSLGRGGGGGGGHGFGGGFHGGFAGHGFGGARGFGGRGFSRWEDHGRFGDRGFRGRGRGFRDRGFRDFDGGFFGFGYPDYYPLLPLLLPVPFLQGLLWILRFRRIAHLCCMFTWVRCKHCVGGSCLKIALDLVRLDFDYPGRRPEMYLPCVIERRGCDVSREPHLYKDISVSKSRT
jgi:hypothetical protein